jgi:hypothetical protein
MRRLRRVLAYELSVAALLELVMWLSVPYVTAGVVFTFLQPRFVDLAEARLQTRLPAGADLVAFGESVLYWPVLLIAPEACLA